ncbi:unnamed protein product [Adineta steineri]|uniref:NAD(P)(+)--arginine ADP-ribosyltransferase n=1 Tax=Adineta steineri TaxID=433720 RepID=A0A813W002_9BILA|nr:unnamed protein product [Adineta steineri]CAF3679318.1 unnamed protein product [Adineta steineri]
MAASNVSELYLACRNGDIESVERQLRNTPLESLSRLEPNGSTCLHAASYYGHKEIVRRLLERGAYRRVINRYGCTPLDEAKTKEIAELFPRSTEAAKERFSDNPIQQPEWQFENDHAEAFARATHWGCIKDRGIKKTVKKIRAANVLVNNGEPSYQIVQNYFDEAVKTGNPIFLLRAYTTESQFYKRLNREMATGNRREVYEKLCGKWTGHYTGIIVRNPVFEPYRFSGQTYRGMTITPSDYAQYKIGIALTNKSFQSTSKSWKIAKGFAYPSNPRPGTFPVILIFTITDRRSALSIDQLSDYQNEEEVLIVPGTLFIVTNINQDEIPYEIEVRQLEWTDEF